MLCVDTPYVWQHVEAGLDRVEAWRDVDGDHRPDRITGLASWGSSEESRTVTVELTSDGSTIEATAGGAFDTMIGREPIPARLVALPEARRAVELALFDRVCDVAEPSLARELAGAPTWWPGRPVLVDNYTVVVGNEWVSYAASNHRRTAKLDLAGGFVVAAQRGSLALWRTAHGVVLVDTARRRYSWLFVVETAKHKLRFPSVRGAKLEGDRAVITVDGQLRTFALPR